jgi:hypothetical protein
VPRDRSRATDDRARRSGRSAHAFVGR